MSLFIYFHPYQATMACKFITFSLLLITSIVASHKISISKSRPIKTIRVKNGDIIDCVDIYKQPAFQHTALKNHIIQMRSNHLHPTTDQTRTSSEVPSQVWQQYGSCPNGTIPIRRTSNNYYQTNIHPSKVIVTPHHSFSVVLTEGFSYSGAKATIKVWRPYVESANDYSSSKVMLRNGPLHAFDNVEAGWTVNPKVYHDNKTRLFAYWTVDGMNTGCFDLTCPGFVQTSREVVLGGDISDLSGSLITIQISKDPYTLNWFLKYDNKEVGYWPGDLFPILRYQANLVLWGGEVSSPKVGTHPHTATAMGSGKWSDVIFSSSGMIKGILIEENSHPLKRPEHLYPSADEMNCYDAYLLDENGQEPVLFYGGPGSRYNRLCP